MAEHLHSYASSLSFTDEIADLQLPVPGCMRGTMAFLTEHDQVFRGVSSPMRSKPQVMNLKIAQRAASLTLPVVSLEHFPPDALILASFSLGTRHAERISCLGDDAASSLISTFTCSGSRKRTLRRIALRANCGSSPAVPARKSAQIISRQ